MSDDPPIIFSRHALTKLEQRHITKEIVSKTILKPAYITAYGDGFQAFRRFGKRYLKVIFARTQNSVIVITQYFVKKLS